MAGTERYLKEGMLPGKEWNGEHVDFVQKAKEFDPSLLTKKAVKILGARHPTDVSTRTVEDETEFAQFCVQCTLRELAAHQGVFDEVLEEPKAEGDQYSDEQLRVIRIKYRNCRSRLITYIGESCAAYLIRKKLDGMSEEQRIRDRQRAERAQKAMEEKRAREAEQRAYEQEYEERYVECWGYSYGSQDTTQAERMRKVREVISRHEGRRIIPLREYAKRLGYPCSRYAPCENGTVEAKGQRVDPRLLFLLITRFRVNPFWLIEDLSWYVEAEDRVWEGRSRREYIDELGYAEKIPMFWNEEAILDWLDCRAKWYRMDGYLSELENAPGHPH